MGQSPNLDSSLIVNVCRMAQRVKVPEPALGRELLVFFLEPVLVLEAGAILQALVTIDANHGSAAIQHPLSPVTSRDDRNRT